MLRAEELDFDLNAEQKRAFNRLKKAHKDCIDAGVIFYNNYGTIGALDSNKWSRYDDARDGVPNDGQNISNEFNLKCNEWADDRHYFHPQDSPLNQKNDESKTIFTRKRL